VNGGNFTVNLPTSRGLNFTLQAKNKSAEAFTSSEFDHYLAYNAATNVPLPVLTWWHDHESEFPQCVILAWKYLSDHHGTGTIKVLILIPE